MSNVEHPTFNAEHRTNKVPAAEALEVARRFVAYLKPRCAKIIVAGSLRRRKKLVSDVEILFVPSFAVESDPWDFFGAQRRVNQTEHAIEQLVDLGILAKRPNKNGGESWGEKNKLGVHVESGIHVDLFTATPENWWNYLVCRTGSAETNVRICNAAIARGWKWNPYGEGFSRDVGLRPRAEIHAVTSEREVFDFVGLEYLDPSER